MNAAFARADEPATHPARDSVRRADTDWLMVLAVLLVFCVHAAQVFSPWQSWHVQNRDRSLLLAHLMLLTGPWLMPLFMFLAGRNAFHSLRTRSNGTFVRERLVRLFVPLLAGTLLLVPPQLYVRRILDGTFQGSFIAFYPHFFEGLYPDGNFSWGHLWFLAYLFVYGLLALPLMRRVERRHRPHAPGGGLPGSATLWVLVGAVILAQVVLRAPFPQTNALVDDWANHALLLPAYVVGFLVASSPALEADILEQRWRMTALGLTATVAITATAWTQGLDFRLPDSYSPWYLWFWAASGVATWAWVFAITGLARLHLTVVPPPLRPARHAVFAFYAFHQPIVVLIAWKLVGSPLGVGPKMLLLLTLAFVVTAGCCALVALWRPAHVLFGMRLAR